MTKTAQDFIQALETLKNPASATSHAKFFQAYPGGYGEGDVFWGLTVPAQRNIGKRFFKVLSLDDLEQLIRHPVHEVRLTTLMLMVLRYQKISSERESLANIYLDNLEYVNNWDLVDSSAAYILGFWFWGKSPAPLFEMAKSKHLWTQRIAVLSSYHFIKLGSYENTLLLAELLLPHKHDLIHKAVGWMLREIVNRDYKTEYSFLAKHYHSMPRTMLRYAIEKYEEGIRQDFLKGRI